MLIGFDRAKIQPLNDDGTADGEAIVIEGTQDKGAAQEAAISGLSSDPVKKYGSNRAYYVSQKGTGNVSMDLTLLDLPADEEARILGYKESATVAGAYLLGEDTAPPYCAVTLESRDTQNNAAIFGFFKGKFGKSERSLKTKEEGNFEPESDKYTYSAVECDKTIAGLAEAKGNTMVQFFGTAADAVLLENAVLRTSA